MSIQNEIPERRDRRRQQRDRRRPLRDRRRHRHDRRRHRRDRWRQQHDRWINAHLGMQRTQLGAAYLITFRVQARALLLNVARDEMSHLCRCPMGKRPHCLLHACFAPRRTSLRKRLCKVSMCLETETQKESSKIKQYYAMTHRNSFHQVLNCQSAGG